jgi:oxygen-independent coproporphyrinogen-3 oxidase
MLDLPDEDAQVRMYDFACDVTSAAGFQQYEISNFAKPGRESQHNLCYWRGEEYAGYGPGAVGRVGMERYVTTKSPERYCEEVGSGIRPWCDQETLTEAELALERVMLGLRLNEGLDLGVAHDARGLERIVENGWAEVEGGRVKLTAKGRHFCSEAVAYLAP